MSQLALIAKQYALAPTDELYLKLATTEKQLELMIKESSAIVVTAVDQVEEMAKARTARLKFKELRLAIERERKDRKEGFLRKGQAIDALARWGTDQIVPEERRLLDAENFALRVEADRKEKLKTDRVAALVKLGAKHEFLDLANMPEDAYQRILGMATTDYEQRENARAAEEVAAMNRQLAQKRENERLALAAAKAEGERKAADQERDEALAKLQAANAGRLAAEAESKRVRDMAAKKDREAVAAASREKSVAEAQKRLAALAPDKDKIDAYAGALLAVPVPAISDPAAGALLKQFMDRLDSQVLWVRSTAKSL